MLTAMAESQRINAGETFDLQNLPAAREVYERERRFWNSDGPTLAEVRDFSIPGPYGGGSRCGPARGLRPTPNRAVPKATVKLAFDHGDWARDNRPDLDVTAPFQERRQRA
jgi:hypothetical protein